MLYMMICHCVFMGKMIYNNLSYDYSDKISNELLKKKNENTSKTILYTTLNLVVDIISNKSFGDNLSNKDIFASTIISFSSIA